MRSYLEHCMILLAVCCLTADATAALNILPGGAATLVEQGGTFAAGNLAGTSAGAVPFSSSELGAELGIPFHRSVNINDEVYGNSNSWIGGDANPYPRPFVGVALNSPSTIESLAFGRSNLTSGDPCAGGVCTDRTLGLYELQYTTEPGPAATTPDASWVSIATLDYQSAGGGNFTQPHARHRFNFAPVNNVTGVRLVVPSTGIGGGTAIDELEVYATAGVLVPPPPSVVLTPSAGYAIGFNGNNGPYDPSSPAGVPDNLALASRGATPIGSSELGVQLGVPFHLNTNINDGLYGNAHSWISADGDGNAFAGVTFPQPVLVDRVAWSRDNGDDAGDCCGGQLTDRSLGRYTLQFTRVSGADGATPETNDPATGWVSFAAVDYQSADPGVFDPALRHEFQVAEGGLGPILATGFRLKPPVAGLNGGTAIDEIEVYGQIVPEPTGLSWMLGCAVLSVAGQLRRRHRA